MPLTILLQFSFDIFVFKEPFSLMQDIALGVLLLAYAFQAAKFLIWDLPREKKREAAKLAELERLDDAIV